MHNSALAATSAVRLVPILVVRLSVAPFVFASFHSKNLLSFLTSRSVAEPGSLDSSSTQLNVTPGKHSSCLHKSHARRWASGSLSRQITRTGNRAILAICARVTTTPIVAMLPGPTRQQSDGPSQTMQACLHFASPYKMDLRSTSSSSAAAPLYRGSPSGQMVRVVQLTTLPATSSTGMNRRHDSLAAMPMPPMPQVVASSSGLNPRPSRYFRCGFWIEWNGHPPKSSL